MAKKIHPYVKKSLKILAFLLFFALPAQAAQMPEQEPITWQHPFDLGEEDISPAVVEAEALPPPPLPAPVRHTQKPVIAIVIDDMGLDRRRCPRAVKNLPAPVTLSYLPYAPHVQQQADAAKAAGHEIMLHMPMEADNPATDPGPHHLSTGMSRFEVLQNATVSLDSFQGYDGVNNHMGSRFTADRAGLEVFMEVLEKRHAYFLDSKTSPDSIAERVAHEHGIPSTRRDVFIDHVETPAFVASALHHIEAIARATGSAVAIGHPKDVTLASLEAWVPTLEAKGFRVVPLSEVVKYRNTAERTAGK